MSCHLLERGSIPDCDELPIGGTETRLILINWDDVLYIYVSNGLGGGGSVWDSTFDFTFGPVVSGSAIGVITQIVLKPLKQAYEFFGFKQDIKKNEEAVNNGKLKTRFIHSTELIIYEIDQVQKKNLQRMAKGRFMAIVENKGKGDDAFELLGKECGLKMRLLRDAHETNGVYKIALQTPDNGVEYERKLPQTVGTSYANGLNIIDGLLVAEDVGFETEDESAIFESEDGQIFIPE